jgi:hypothetical protein
LKGQGSKITRLCASRGELGGPFPSAGKAPRTPQRRQRPALVGAITQERSHTWMRTEAAQRSILLATSNISTEVRRPIPPWTGGSIALSVDVEPDASRPRTGGAYAESRGGGGWVRSLSASKPRASRSYVRLDRPPLTYPWSHFGRLAGLARAARFADPARTLSTVCFRATPHRSGCLFAVAALLGAASPVIVAGRHAGNPFGDCAQPPVQTRRTLALARV